MGVSDSGKKSRGEGEEDVEAVRDEAKGVAAFHVKVKRDPLSLCSVQDT